MNLLSSIINWIFTFYRWFLDIWILALVVAFPVYMYRRMVAARQVGKRYSDPEERAFAMQDEMDRPILEELEKLNKFYDKKKGRPFLWPFM